MAPSTIIRRREKSRRLGGGSFRTRQALIPWRKNRTKYQYDNLGRKTAVIAPAAWTTLDNGTQATISPTTYYGYDADGNLKYVTDPRGAANAGGQGPGDPNYTTWYFFDGLNRQTCAIDALAGLTTTQGLASQPPASITNATVTTYDALGDVSTVAQYVVGTTTRTTQYVYDDLGRKTQEIDPQVTNGLTGLPVTPTTTYSYDLDNNLLSTTDPDLHTTWTVYDALNRPVKTVSADGSGPNDTHYATTTVYDAVGNALSVTDPDGNTTSYSYDRLNRQTQSVNPLWFTSSTQYDFDGNIVQTTDFDGRTTRYSYDADGRKIEEDWLSANGNVIHATKTYYDSDGQVYAIVDPSATYYYQRNQDGQVVRSRMVPGDLPQPSSPSWTNTWSGQTLPNGSNYSATYQTAALDIGTALTATLTITSGTYPLELEFESPSGVWYNEGTTTGTLQATLTLDEQGVWTVWIGVANWAQSAVHYSLTASAMGVNSLADLNYAHDAAGNVKSVADTSGLFANQGGTTAYAYDALNELTQITNTNTSGSSGITAKCVALAYNADGSLNTITRYNGANTSSLVVATTEYWSTTGGAGSGYDAMGRVTAMQQVYGSSPSTTVSYTWQYDPASNITQSYNSTDGTDAYTTDSANQITAANPTGSLPTEAYSYDQNGNRTGGGYATGADNRLLSEVVSGVVYNYEYLCSCQLAGVDFVRPVRRLGNQGTGWLSFAHSSMAA